MTIQQEATRLMRQLERHHILEALDKIDEGETGRFAQPIKYDLVVNGQPYPPKRVVGVALRLLSGGECHLARQSLEQQAATSERARE